MSAADLSALCGVSAGDKFIVARFNDVRDCVVTNIGSSLFGTQCENITSKIIDGNPAVYSNCGYSSNGEDHAARLHVFQINIGNGVEKTINRVGLNPIPDDIIPLNKLNEFEWAIIKLETCKDEKPSGTGVRQYFQANTQYCAYTQTMRHFIAIGGTTGDTPTGTDHQRQRR